MKTQDFSMRERGIYKNIEAYLKAKHGDRAKDLIISPGFLRVEQALANTKSKYTFDFKKAGNEVATELKLDRNDLFVVSRIGLYLSVQDATTVGKEVLQSYPNETAFTTAGVTPSHLETIYNGYSSLKIANRVNIENLSNLEFKYAPDTQQSSATNKSSFNLTDATYKPAALIYLHGTMDINFTTEFPSFSSIAITPSTAGTTARLVLVPFGFLVKGGASAK